MSDSTCAKCARITGTCSECGGDRNGHGSGGMCNNCANRKRRIAHRLNPKPCSVPGCDNNAYAGIAMCSKHHSDMKRFGEIRPYLQDRAWLAREDKITQADVAEVRARILAEQDGKCRLCGTSETPRWHLDHDHRCCNNRRICENCLRSVLCHRCNISLGLFDDDPAILRRAAEYLESFQR